MAKVTPLKKKNEESLETLLAKVRGVMHMGSMEDQRTMKDVIEAFYMKTFDKELQSAPEEVMEQPAEKEQISGKLFDEIHWELEKAIAVADVLGMATDNDAVELPEGSVSFTVIQIRDTIQAVRDSLRLASEGKWTPKS